MTSKHRSHRRRWIAAIAAVAATAATGTVVAASAGGSTSSKSPVADGPTATIAVRDLVQTDDQPGTLGYPDTRNVYNQLSGTVTWVPLAGAVIGQDGVLYRVDGNGVYLFDGTEPMYRPFASGMSDGGDVGELNRDLHAMGYDSGEAIDMSNVDHFQTATGDAIDRWQKAHGLDQTGGLDLGRVVFLSWSATDRNGRAERRRPGDQLGDRGRRDRLLRQLRRRFPRFLRRLERHCRVV
jgi:putative peptidoglycan binding protein